jgi:hypothetical protein
MPGGIKQNRSINLQMAGGRASTFRRRGRRVPRLPGHGRQVRKALRPAHARDFSWLARRRRQLSEASPHTPGTTPAWRGGRSRRMGTVPARLAPCDVALRSRRSGAATQWPRRPRTGTSTESATSRSARQRGPDRPSGERRRRVELPARVQRPGPQRRPEFTLYPHPFDRHAQQQR